MVEECRYKEDGVISEVWKMGRVLKCVVGEGEGKGRRPE